MKLKTLMKNTNRKVSYTEVLTTQWILPTKASKKKKTVQSGVNQKFINIYAPGKRYCKHNRFIWSICKESTPSMIEFGH